MHNNDRIRVSKDSTFVCLLHRGYFSCKTGQFYNPQTDQVYLGLLGATSALGDALAVVLGELLIKRLSLDWSIYFVFFAFLLFLSAMFVMLFIDEYSI